MFNCRTKLEKLLCLKYLGSKSLAKTVGSHTMKEDPSSFHETTSFMVWSSTIWYVFVKNGVGIVLDVSPPPVVGVSVLFCSTRGGGDMAVGWSRELRISTRVLEDSVLLRGFQGRRGEEIMEREEREGTLRFFEKLPFNLLNY